MKSILLESNFDIEKLGFAGVYLSFLFWLQNIDCGYSLEPPHTHNHCIVHNEEILYIQLFYLKKNHFYNLKNPFILLGHVSVIENFN